MLMTDIPPGALLRNGNHTYIVGRIDGQWVRCISDCGSAVHLHYMQSVKMLTDGTWSISNGILPNGIMYA